ncbi:Holliday junction resolvase RuvX [Candidatus Mycosynbacter amalyticus]|uniref:Putative pre-16S rRNA nuclease n=1 Tax=Candidatus Mycosynbacter amalyticus TaxID=2665156 RepID=A0A857MR03_9BACT|nr:Holliday junction resolvase RuvX [Candidatus Mycosynbacter amalyticus]QHN43060.1 Holliday junction resolvase RuvX [Candidatus Mycosynbacter amalyticus]
MGRSQSLIALDVGERRIGVAAADTGVRIAIPYDTIEVDGTEVQQVAEIVVREGAGVIVVGFPRNQQGEATAQSAYAEGFASKLEDIGKIVFQDESLTSVIAENRLKSRGKPYVKGDIDKEAAAIILQDYLEQHYAA